VLGQDRQLTGPLNVTTIDSLALLHAKDFRDFTKQFPAIELEVSADGRSRSLIKREADVALRVSNSPPEHLVGRKIGRWEFAIFGSRTLVETIGVGTDWSQWPWLSWDPRFNARLTEAWMREHAPGARIVCRVDTGAVMETFVRAGLGLQFFAGRYRPAAR
jgi:DNA-binding transcriptional LysR family regulator